VLYDPIHTPNGKVLQGFKLGALDDEADARLVDWQTSPVIVNCTARIFRYDIATDTVVQINPIFYRASPLSHDGRKIALFQKPFDKE